jgi:K+-transporting ATPase ATPase C chain
VRLYRNKPIYKKELFMKTFIQSLMILLVFTLLTGIIYPLLITGISQLAFPKQANGSLIYKNGENIGSELIGQSFTNASYFHGRPSASDYDASASGGYNLGPASSNLIMMVSNRIEAVRKNNNLDKNMPIPPDMVLASASGLDPDISVDNAYLQMNRIAGTRRIPVENVKKLINSHKDVVQYGFWGIDKINVLKLNIELDK